MMSLWDALRMNMMISYQELVRTFPSYRSFIAACNGSLLVCALESGFRIVRYRMLPGPHLENIDSGRREKLSDVNASYGGSKPRLRVTMYIINDTRAG